MQTNSNGIFRTQTTADGAARNRSKGTGTNTTLQLHKLGTANGGGREGGGGDSLLCCAFLQQRLPQFAAHKRLIHAVIAALRQLHGWPGCQHKLVQPKVAIVAAGDAMQVKLKSKSARVKDSPPLCARHPRAGSHLPKPIVTIMKSEG